LNHQNLYIIAISLLVLSCKDTVLEEAIKRQYEKDIKSSTMENLSIRIIEEHNPTFEELVIRELDRMESANHNLLKLVKVYSSLDSLYKKQIDQRNCFHKNATKEYQVKYETENKSDSVCLQENVRKWLNTELLYYENELKMLAIDSLVKTAPTLLEPSKWVKHEIKYTTNKEIRKDTVIFIEFGKAKFSYLTESIY